MEGKHRGMGELMMQKAISWSDPWPTW